MLACFVRENYSLEMTKVFFLIYGNYDDHDLNELLWKLFLNFQIRKPIIYISKKRIFLF